MKPLRAAGRERGDRHRLDEGERVLFHEDAILERARLGFVGVAHQVVRRRRPGADGVPLPSGGERGAAAAHQPRGGDFGHYRLGAHRERLLERREAARGAVRLEARGIDVSDTTKQAEVGRRLAEPRLRGRSVGSASLQDRLHAIGGDVAEQILARMLPGNRHERRGRLVALAETRRPHPDRARVADGHVRAGRRVAVRRAGRSLERGGNLVRTAALARDVIADVHDAPGPRRRRQQRVERGDAPCIGGGHVQTIADVAQPPLADPAHTRLERLEGGQQQVAHRAGVAATHGRHVRVARIATRTAVP